MMVEGIFTHFARADEADKAFTFYQMEQFKKMIAMMDARNVTIPIHHCSNSAGHRGDSGGKYEYGARRNHALRTVAV